MAELSGLLVVSPIVAKCVLANNGIAKLLSVLFSTFSALVKSKDNYVE
jgi:hypothetical protein